MYNILVAFTNLNFNLLNKNVYNENNKNVCSTVKRVF